MIMECILVIDSLVLCYKWDAIRKYWEFLSKNYIGLVLSTLYSLKDVVLLTMSLEV